MQIVDVVSCDRLIDHRDNPELIGTEPRALEGELNCDQ